MNRYFAVRDEDMPTLTCLYGHYHFIDLASHGPAGDKWNLVCLTDNHVRPHQNWIAFPPLYDAKTTLAVSAVPHETLADLGLTGEETCIEAVMRLGEINPIMGL